MNTRYTQAQQYDDAIAVAARHFMRGDMRMFVSWFHLAKRIRINMKYDV